MAGWILPVLSIASSLLQGIGQKKSGDDQSAATAQSAAIARETANQVMVAGALERIQMRRQKEQFLGRQHAAYAKAGVLHEGSPVSVAIDTRSQFELDELIQRYNVNTEASRLRSEAGYLDKQSRDQRTAGTTNMLSTLLTSGVNIYSKYRTTSTVSTAGDSLNYGEALRLGNTSYSGPSGSTRYTAS